jgi:hypothetical protein
MLIADSAQRNAEISSTIGAARSYTSALAAAAPAADGRFQGANFDHGPNTIGESAVAAIRFEVNNSASVA